MKYQNVKSVGEIKLPPNTTIELDQVDSSYKAVSFFIDGKFAFRVAMDSYNMYLQRQADPKTKEVYRLSGNILGIPVLKDFDHEWNANEEASRLRNGIQEAEKATLVVEKTLIEVEDK